jgi:hypothetical protein
MRAGELALAVVGISGAMGMVYVAGSTQGSCDRACEHGLLAMNSCHGVLIGSHVVVTASHCLKLSGAKADVAGADPDPKADCSANIAPGIAVCELSGEIRADTDHVIFGSPNFSEKLLGQPLEAPIDLSRMQLRYVDQDRESHVVRVVGFEDRGATIVACGTRAVRNGDSGGPLFAELEGVETLVGVVFQTDGRACSEVPGGQLSRFSSLVTAEARGGLDEWRARAPAIRQVCGVTPGALGCRS